MNDWIVEKGAGCFVISVWLIGMLSSLAILAGLCMLLYAGAKLLGWVG